MQGGRMLVTGAAGFIGSHLVESLLADGHQVVGIDSFEDYYPRPCKEANIARAREDERFTLVEADIVDLAEEGAGFADAPQDAGAAAAAHPRPASRLAALVAEADYVFHLAAQAGVRASWGRSFEVYTRNNVLATQLLLEACREAVPKRFIYASSSSVYGDTDVFPMREDALCRPHSPYGVTKLAAEHLAYLYWRNFGVPTVSLRFFTVYGPRQRPDMAFHRMTRALLAGEPVVVYGDGAQTRDFTYISDIVAGIRLAMDGEPGSVFNLGGGSRVSLSEALDVLGEVVGVEPRIDRQGRQAGDVRDTSASLELAIAGLGYRPQVPLREGLSALVDWMRTRP